MKKAERRVQNCRSYSPQQRTVLVNCESSAQILKLKEEKSPEQKEQSI